MSIAFSPKGGRYNIFLGGTHVGVFKITLNLSESLIYQGFHRLQSYYFPFEYSLIFDSFSCSVQQEISKKGVFWWLSTCYSVPMCSNQQNIPYCLLGIIFCCSVCIYPYQKIQTSFYRKPVLLDDEDVRTWFYLNKSNELFSLLLCC